MSAKTLIILATAAIGTYAFVKTLEQVSNRPIAKLVSPQGAVLPLGSTTP